MLVGDSQEFEIVAKNSPDVVSVKDILNLGNVLREEFQRLIIKDCPTIPFVVSIDKYSSWSDVETGGYISGHLLGKHFDILDDNLIALVIIKSHVNDLLMEGLVTKLWVALLDAD